MGNIKHEVSCDIIWNDESVKTLNNKDLYTRTMYWRNRIKRDFPEVDFLPLTSVTYSGRLKSCYGRAAIVKDGMKKGLSAYKSAYIKYTALLLKSGLSAKTIDDTIVHELIHTIRNEDTINSHSGDWIRYKNLFNKKYGLNISAESTLSSKGGNGDLVYKYTVICNKCGYKYHHARLCNVVKNPNAYGCGNCHSYKCLTVQMNY